MKKGMSVLALVCGMVLFTGCDDDDVVNNIANEPDLNGRYTAACSEVPVINVGSQDTLRFEADSKFESYAELYTSDDCSDAEIVGTFRLEGEYRVDNDGAPDSEGGAIRLELNAAFVRLDSDALVTAANTANFCGYSNYEKGVEVEVSGSSDDFNCPFVKAVPDTLYGVYREDDGTFYLNEGGLSNMSQSQEERPQGLDMGKPYTKQ